LFQTELQYTGQTIQVILVRQELLEHKVLRVHKDQQELRDQPAHKVLLEHKALRVHKVL